MKKFILLFVVIFIIDLVLNFHPIQAAHRSTYNPKSNMSGLLQQTTSPSTIYLPLIQLSDDAFYVSTNGSDSNPGTVGLPWRTLQYAVNHAPDKAIIVVRAGEYNGFTLSRSNLIIRSFSNENVSITGNGSSTYTTKILNSSNIQISGLVFHNNQIQYSAGVFIQDSAGITVKGSTFYDHQGFGIVTKDVSNVLIENNDLYENANAIEIRYGSSNVTIRNNKIHNNYREVDGGRGAIGITFYRTTGPVTATGNQLWDNHSIDKPDPEGAAFEVYAGGNVAMIGNTIWENETVLETGTKDQVECSNISFIRNIVYRINRQQGLILRCASDSLFANNTFDGLDEYVFYLTHFKGSYGGSIERLTIVNNIAVNGRVYSIETPIPDSVIINHNLVYNPGSPSIRGEFLAYYSPEGNTSSLAEFQSWSGYDLQSLSLPPKFLDAGKRDYRLQPGSPAINLGIDIGEPFIGVSPDAGAFEFTP